MEDEHGDEINICFDMDQMDEYNDGPRHDFEVAIKNRSLELEANEELKRSVCNDKKETCHYCGVNGLEWLQCDDFYKLYDPVLKKFHTHQMR